MAVKAKQILPRKGQGRRNNVITEDQYQDIMDTGGGGGGTMEIAYTPGGGQTVTPVGPDDSGGGIQAMVLPPDVPPTGPVILPEPESGTMPVVLPVIVSDQPAPIEPAIPRPADPSAQGFPPPTSAGSDVQTLDPIIHEVAIGQDGNIVTSPANPPITGSVETVDAPASGTASTNTPETMSGMKWYWWLLIAIIVIVLVSLIAKHAKK